MRTAAGGDWPQGAREAAVALSSSVIREDQSLSMRLLSDIQHIFDKKGVDTLPSKALVGALLALDDTPLA